MVTAKSQRVESSFIDDEVMVRRVLEGDRRSFDVLVLKYQNKLMTLVSRFLKNDADVSDVVQDSFVKAYRSLDSFRGESSFYTWLSKITVNTTKNYISSHDRRLSRHPDERQVLLDAAPIGTPSHDFETPDANVSADQLKQAIFDSIEKLPTKWSTALKLREIEGMSYEEISGIMNCPVGTVRSRIFRARETIMKDIRPSFPGTFGNRKGQ